VAEPGQTNKNCPMKSSSGNKMSGSFASSIWTSCNVLSPHVTFQTCFTSILKVEQNNGTYLQSHENLKYYISLLDTGPRKINLDNDESSNGPVF
jgi:hypothetical protein